MKRAVIVWGTSSGAGKSLLTTALCRWAARRGIDVAPFKAQNMSNNARVVALADDDGFGEIGAAQYFQALAARTKPTVDMNPVLLKPVSDTASQVVVQGRVDAALSALPWRERSTRLAVAARDSFARLRAAHELIVVEGAGSPAEINLAAHDYVNLDTARWAHDGDDTGAVTSLLVADIDRGGAFAHLFGTWSLLPDDLRPTLSGFVLNKFRGDAALLAPGPGQLQAMTGVPVVGVLPMRRDHGLPDEDAMTGAPPVDGAVLRIAIVAYPRISNLDEFEPLRRVPGLRLTWARSDADLAGADWVILPGSKQVGGDLRWLRETGIDRAITHHAGRGRRVLGICGGLQMLGTTLDDPQGVDGVAGRGDGLGLLPVATRYAATKRLAAVQAGFGGLGSPWTLLNGIELPAYEIRNGVTEAEAAGSHGVLHDDRGRPIGWQRGPVLGIAAHGLFESPAVMETLFGVRTRSLDDVFDGLADLIDTHLDAAWLRRWVVGAGR